MDFERERPQDPDSDDPAHGEVAADGDESDRVPHPVAAAPNWRSVILADAALGAGAVVVGTILAFVWIPLLGAGFASLGIVYVAMALRRGARWAAWRRRVGLDRAER